MSLKQGESTQSNSSIDTSLATGLEVPWGMGFLPDGWLLVTERKGTVRLIGLNQKRTEAKIIARINEVAVGSTEDCYSSQF
ncbi:PQQ-dependent sugar dehydrogenase [Coxiella-like endosymbiont]|uniref:PQQ-dependent sugar dehydrogenase n=1 Tax=Coxiella-like endosymbiont TaxID=1592897 RepID=UPI00272B3770|nr:PQQ-dependent sugar dehydrogenase [Coxiella-like endosymbiont]